MEKLRVTPKGQLKPVGRCLNLTYEKMTIKSLVRAKRDEVQLMAVGS